MSKRPKILKTSSGITILESLIAISIVMVMMFVTVSFFVGQSSKARTLSTGGACKIALETQMNYFRQQSVAPFSMKWKTAENDISKEIVDSKNFVDPWLGKFTASNTDFDLVDDSGSGAPVIYTPYLQRGLMGTLGALYNTDKIDLCSSPVDLNKILGEEVKQPLMIPEDKNDLSDFKSQIQIQTYQLNNPDAQADCTRKGSLWLRPQGATNAATQNPPIARFPPNVSDQYGYRVTLNGYYVGKDKVVKTCSLSEDFRYPIDHEVQKPVLVVNTDVARDANNKPVMGILDSSGQGAKNDASVEQIACASPTPGRSSRKDASQPPGTEAYLKLEVGFKSESDANLEPGTVILCRDRSYQLNANYCMKKSDKPNKPLAPSNRWGTGAVMNGSGISPKDTAAYESVPWVSCSKATVCGVPPSSTSTFNSKTGKYTLEYEGSGLWGCDVRMDVATVDSAGNFKRLSDFGETITRKYFQGPDCYACAKKKPFGFIKIIAVFAAGWVTVGAAWTTLALCGATGCSGSGYKWKRNSATNTPKKGEKCKHTWFGAIQEYPKWWGKKNNLSCSTNGAAPINISCPTLIGSYAGAPGVNYTIPEATEGSFADVPVYYDLQKGKYCAIQAECEKGKWMGAELENGQRASIENCGKIVTQMKLDISNLSPGASSSSANSVPVCTFPIESNVILDPDRSYYNGFQFCSKSKTGEAVDLLCKIIPPVASGGLETYEFPVDPMTTGPADSDVPYYPTYSPITKASQTYTYFEHRLPVDPNLKPCGIQE